MSQCRRRLPVRTSHVKMCQFKLQILNISKKIFIRPRSGIDPHQLFTRLSFLFFFFYDAKTSIDKYVLRVSIIK